MYAGKNKITALVLVLLLAIPLIFSLVIVMQQNVLQINSQLRFGIEKTETISVLKKNINWVKEGKEVLISGKYFDVKKFKTEGNIVLLTGYFDYKEDKMVNQIKKFFQQKKDSNIPINQSAVKFLFFSLFTTPSQITIASNLQKISCKFYAYSEKIPLDPLLQIKPPPKL